MIRKRSYNVDCFYYVPYVIEDIDKFEKAKALFSKDISEGAALVLKEMEYRFNYECDKAVCMQLTRGYIGDILLRCDSDSAEHEFESAECMMHVFINYSDISGLAVLSLVSLFSDIPIHFMTEEFYRGNGVFVTDGGEIPIDEYMLKNFALKRCGDVKGLVALDKYPEDINEILYMSVAEEYGTQDVDSTLKANPRLELKNISQYEIVDIYMNEPMIVCIFNEPDKSAKERVYEESIILQIIEYALFKITAINRTNRRVVEELEKNGKPSIRFIEELNVQYAHTIRFWDTANFTYFTTRNLAYEIAAGFKVDEIYERYCRNQDFLEHLINIREVQGQERETTLLNILAIVLAVIECLPVSYEVFSLLIAGKLTSAHLLNALGAISFTCIIIFIFILLLKKTKSKNKRKNRKIKL